MVRRLFEPLGWQVGVTAVPRDERFPEWGGSRYFRVALAGRGAAEPPLRATAGARRRQALLTHYWVDESEVENLLAKGEGWLETHPARDARSGQEGARARGFQLVVG